MTDNEAAPHIARSGRITVYELFRSRARRDPNALAIEYGETRLTYAQIDARVSRLAGGLVERGVTRGERIALVSENRPEYLELQLAAAMVGAIVACQNWRLAQAELSHCIALVTPKLVIASARFHAATKAACELPILDIDADWDSLSGAPLEGESPVDQEDGLVILYTSGTTGMPKGALVSHRAEIARMTALRIDLGVREDDAFVAWAPLFIMGSTDQSLAALMSGAPVVVIDGFDAARIVNATVDHRLGWLLLMPGSIEPVVDLLRTSGATPRGIRAIGAMADLVPTALIADLTRLSRAPYLNSFGSTETGLPPCSNQLIPPGAVPASLSKRQSALCDIKLVDEDGNEVAQGEPGEMAIRGPTVFSGYWRADETNRRDFAGGYFRMGDLFRRNADGTYDFVDRAKYMIKSGGENI